jgi:tetratricopeptide (TPR) repeat protein
MEALHEQRATQENRRAFLGKIRDALELMLLDAELIANGFTYLYVVDFAAIFGYMYKTSKLPFLPIPGESEERTFARHQMALHTVFTKYPRPLLVVPPYSSEIENHVRSIGSNAELAQLDTVLYKAKLTRLIEESKDFREFIALANRKPSQPHDDSPLRQAALTIGRNYFPELYAAISCISIRSLETLQTLYRDDTLRDADEVLPECRTVDYSGDVADTWYYKIYKERTRGIRKDTRAVQSWTDAMACAYVELANQRVNLANKIVVFLAPSGNVETILRQRNLISLPSRGELTAVRDLTYCLLAFGHRNERESGNAPMNKALLKKSLDTVSSLYGVYSSPIPAEWRDDAEERTLDWKRIENMLLMRDSSASDDLPGDTETARDKEFLIVLELLHRAMTGESQDVLQQVASDLSHLQNQTIDLEKRIQVNRFRTITVTKPSDGMRTVFSGFQGELTLVLSFTSKDVANLARRFQQLKAKRYPEDSVLALRKHVLDKAKKADALPEHHLLAGYMLAVEGKYDVALTELDLGREMSEGVARRELMFLSAVVNRKMHRTKQAIEILIGALERYGDDPRLNLEYAKALWLGWHESSDGKAADSSLHTALEHLRIALKGRKEFLDRELRVQIDNVAAFIYTELVVHGRFDPNDGLEKARSHLDNMKKLKPEKDWVARFFDTRGYWHYATAQSLPPDKRPEKIEHLEKALRDLDQSLKSEEDIGPWPNIRLAHRSLVTTALERDRQMT